MDPSVPGYLQRDGLCSQEMADKIIELLQTDLDALARFINLGGLGAIKWLRVGRYNHKLEKFELKEFQ